MTVAGLVLELSDAQVDELREQLAIERVPRGESPTERRALDVKGMAAKIGRSVDFVYDHARELGGEKIGGVWVFDRDSRSPVSAGADEADLADASPRRRQRTRHRGASLAIRGSKPL